MGNCINSSLSRTVNHPQLGQLQKQYHEDYTVEYFKALIKVHSKDKYDKWASEVKKITYNAQTKNVLFIPQKFSLHQGDMFKNETQVEVFYEPYIETLEDLVSRYRIRNVHPSEELLWYLIYTLTKVGKYFQKINSKIGNTILSNIVVSSNKQFKVICSKSTLDFMSPVQQIKLKLSDKVLLAPQQIQYLNKSLTKDPKDEVNPQLSEVFTFGILVLGVAALFQPHYFYNYHSETPNKISIDQGKIDSILQDLKKTRRVSELLLQTIREMIEPKPQKRIKSTHLFKRLSEYENQILTKKGINYSGEQLSVIKESLNGSFASRNHNHSFQTNGNKSLQNHSISFRVSEISEPYEAASQNSISDRFTNAKYFKTNTDFVNIL